MEQLVREVSDDRFQPKVDTAARSSTAAVS
jgi:hypothetical protein